MEIFLYHLEELDALVSEIWAKISQAQAVALVGDLGAGKTTFVVHLCKYLHVKDEVSSPTFALYNEYEVHNNAVVNRIIHADLYRIEGLEELFDIGFEEMLQSPQTLFLIEWPQISEPILPADTLLLYLTIEPDGRRKLQIQPYFE